jgi:hypothetical protein
MIFYWLNITCCAQNPTTELDKNLKILHIDTISIKTYCAYIRVNNEFSNDTLNVLVEKQGNIPEKIDTLKLGGIYKMELQKISKLKIKEGEYIRLFENKFYVDDKLIFEDKDNTYLLLSIN